jgi:polyadenylate-binding protein
MNTQQTTPSLTSTSLYVGDLKPDITETQLYELFKTVGPIASIRVCRDAITRRSLGYAYINFINYADAERAIDLFNYKDIKGKPCRIMWCQRDPALRKSNVGNIFIKNLDKGIDNKSLYDTFSKFGNILSCKVSTDEQGKSKGFAFIHFATQEEADEAIRKVNGKLITGKQVFVGPFVAKKERNYSDPKWTNIYVKYLDKSVDDQKLKEMFEVFGPITSSVIMKDENGESKGFAFINYDEHESADKAVAEMHEKEISGKQLYVQRAQKKEERERVLRDLFTKIQQERMSKWQGVNLYVKNLDESIDDEKLRQEFSKFGGTITSAKVMKDEKTGTSKGFGFVCFSTPEEATKAVTEMNGVMLCDKPVYVALAQKKEERKQHLQVRIKSGFGMTGMNGNGFYSPYYQMPRAGGMYYPQKLPQQRGYPMPPMFMAPPFGKEQRGMRRNPNPNPNYPNLKFSSNTRNPQIQTPVEAPVQPMNNQLPDGKWMYGEALYPLIEVVLRAFQKDELTGKITGMLLESMENSELNQLLESPEVLNAKISEARAVLENFQSAEAKDASDVPVLA